MAGRRGRRRRGGGRPRSGPDTAPARADRPSPSHSSLSGHQIPTVHLQHTLLNQHRRHCRLRPCAGRADPPRTILQKRARLECGGLARRIAMALLTSIMLVDGRQRRLRPVPARSEANTIRQRAGITAISAITVTAAAADPTNCDAFFCGPAATRCCGPSSCQSTAPLDKRPPIPVRHNESLSPPKTGRASA